MAFRGKLLPPYYFRLGHGIYSNIRQFLAVRAFFGVAMGGIYGNAAATALGACPEAARGLLSGMYQPGHTKLGRNGKNSLLANAHIDEVVIPSGISISIGLRFVYTAAHSSPMVAKSTPAMTEESH
jgi:MFS family permease